MKFLESHYIGELYIYSVKFSDVSKSEVVVIYIVYLRVLFVRGTLVAERLLNVNVNQILL